MIKRFGLSSFVVVLLSALVTVVATADFNPNGTLGTGGTSGTDRPEFVGSDSDPKGAGPEASADPDLVVVTPPSTRPLPAAVKSIAAADSRSNVRLADGSLDLDIPAGLSKNAVEISIEPQPAPSGGGVRIFRQWDLRATDQVEQKELHRFGKEITLKSVFNPDEVRGIDWSSLTFVWFDPDLKRWERIPSTVDFETRTVTAKTDHFSIFGLQGSSAYALPGQIMDYQVNLNSGAASYSYPIQLPPGRGGFQPFNLALSYNSGVVDEMKHKADMGSWVGIGWSLDLPHIFRNEETGDHSIVLNGVSSELIGDFSVSPHRFYTNPVSGLRIERHNQNGTDFDWDVKDQNGTHYNFSRARESSSGGCFSDYEFRWDLTEVVDVHGNTFEVQWVDEAASCSSVRATYPSKILAKDGAAVLWTAEFTSVSQTSKPSAREPLNWYQVRHDMPDKGGDHPDPLIADTRQLNSISIKSGTDLVRKYVFEYTTDAAGVDSDIAGEHRLDSVQLFGDDGTTAAPKTSFGYGQKRNIYFHNTQKDNETGLPGNPFDFNRSYLETVTNGFGGKITFEYEQMPKKPTAGIWTRQLVKRVTADPDTSNAIDGVPIVTEYEYLDSSGNPTNPVYKANTAHIAADQHNADYRGFPKVRVISGDGAYSETDFIIYEDPSFSHPLLGNVSRSGDSLIGKSIKTDQFDFDGTRLTSDFTNWNAVDIGPPGLARYQVRVDDSGTQVFESDGTTEASRSWTYFDEFDVYGNVLRQRVLGDASTTADDVSIFNTFGYNTSASVWIVNRLAHSRSYAGSHTTEPGSNKIAESKNFYDGNVTLGTIGTKGNLTSSEVFSGPSTSITTSTTYDPDTGTVSTSTDGLGRITDFEYDGTLKALVTKTKLPAVGTDPRIFSETIFDTAKDVVKGLPNAQRDENGNETKFKYDELGRTKEIARPGDTIGDPTTRFDYVSWGTLGSQALTIEAKTDRNPSVYAKRTEFFDGLGRVVQAHEVGASPGKTLVMQTQIFDSNGRAIVDFIPWEVTGTPTTYQSPYAGQSSVNQPEFPSTASVVGTADKSWVNAGNLTADDGVNATVAGTGPVVKDSGWVVADKVVPLPGSTSEGPWREPNRGLTTDGQTTWNWFSSSGWGEARDLAFYFNRTDNVPSDAKKINGVEPRVRGLTSDGAGHVSGQKIHPFRNGQDVLNVANLPLPEGTLGYGLVGGPTFLWGVSWNVAHVNSGGDLFGYELKDASGQNLSLGDSSISIDSGEVKIYYDYFWSSNEVEVKDFGFDIPGDARIDGIQVSVDRTASIATGNDRVRDLGLQLGIGTNELGDPKNPGGSWSTSATTVNYGGMTDTWGREWTPHELNNPDFGVRLSVQGDNSTASVDYIKVIVHYTEPLTESSVAHYDALGRVVEQSGADGATIKRAYAPSPSDGEVWQEAITDPLGNIVRNYTDAFGRITRIEEANTGLGSGWPQSFIAPAPESFIAPTGGDQIFGFEVDYDGQTLIVGAPGADNGGGALSGLSYIYKHDGSSWVRQATLSPSDGEATARFGYSVGVDGDHAVIGAIFHSGGGAAYVSRQTSPGVWSDPVHLTLPPYISGSDQFGIAVAIDGETLVVGSDYENGQRGAAAVYEWNSGSSVWDYKEPLTASDAAANDLFGHSVAIDGDTIVVGADLGDCAVGNTGSAYVFVRSGGLWSEQDELCPNDPGAAGDNFGARVAISGNTAVVSALTHDAGANNAGAAYVFTQNGVDWPQQAKLVEPTQVADNNFGQEVEINGDQLAVSAMRGDSGTTDGGSVYTYERQGTTWTHQGTIDEGSAASNNDHFGYSLRIENGHLIVGGAYDSNANGADGGIVYDFDISKSFVAPTGGDQYFGFEVDYDGTTLIIGAAGADNGGGALSGLSYIYTHDGSSWVRQATLSPSDGEASARFGYSVGVDGDHAVIGAILHSGGGAAYVSRQTSPGVWSDPVHLTLPPYISGGDQFGISVAIDGEILVVGSDRENGLRGAAAVYEWNSGTSTWDYKKPLTASDAAANDYLGYSVAIDGDTVVVGARFGNCAATNTGSAYVFTRSGGLWLEQDELCPTDAGVANDWFGERVAVSGDTVVVGAPEHLDTGSNAGAAYVFTQSGANWSQEAKLVELIPATGNRFGQEVEINGDQLAVSAIRGDSAVTNGGSVYTYLRQGTTWTLRDTFDEGANASDNDHFGYSLRIEGAHLIVGAAYDSNANGADGGTVYDFDVSTSFPYRETRYTYDALGNLINVQVDPLADATLPTVETVMEFDWLGRKTSHLDPDIGVPTPGSVKKWLYEYDGNSNLTKQTDARGVVIEFSYDELNRETERNCTSGCQPGATPPVELASFGYDEGTNGKGRRTSAISGVDQVVDNYAYDSRGRLLTQTRIIGADSYTTSFTYDPADRLLTTTLPNGEVVSQTYSPRGLPETLTSTVIGEVVSSSNYNVLDLPTQIDFGNGVSDIREYFGIEHNPGTTTNFGQLRQIRTGIGPVAAVDLAFTWDVNGNLTSRTDQLGLDGPELESFGYDFLNRLTQATLSDTAPAPTAPPTPDHSYPFDSLVIDIVKDTVGDLDGTAAPAVPNGPVLTTGVFNSALQFDDTDDYVALPNGVLDGASELTVAFWLKTTDTFAATIVSGTNSTEPNEFEIEIYGGNAMDFWADGFGGLLTGLPSVADGAWHHIAVTYSDSNDEVEVFVNGVSEATGWTSGGALDIDLNGLYLGQDEVSLGGGFSAGYGLNGALDEFRVFRRVLTSTEIAALADKSDPHSRWRLDEFSGSTAFDSAGDSDGSLNGGATRISPARFAGGVSFDGVNDYIDLPNTALDGIDESSVSLWFKTGATGTQTLVSGANSFNSGEFLMQFQSDTSFDLVADGMTDSWTGLTSVADNNWHHLVVVMDTVNFDRTLYIDGVSQGTKNGLGSELDIDSGGLIVGQSQNVVGLINEGFQSFSGEIDDIQVFRTALTSSEVSDIYTGATNLPTTTHDYLYDGHDNITRKRGQGDYTYDVTDRPHLVSGTTTSGANAYTYDDNGNTTVRPNQILTWNEENLLQEVEITLPVPPPDTTPPVLSAGAPSGTLPAGTTQTTLRLNTDEPATCQYDTIPFPNGGGSTVNFTTTGGRFHAVVITGLADGSSHNYYINCRDTATPIPNSNTDDYTIAFTVDTANSDLVGHWTFDDGTGTDSSANNNDGTVNGAVLATGHIGAGALDFDGTNDYVDLGNLDVPGSAITVAAWVNSDLLTNCGATDCRILSKAVGVAEQDHYIMLSTITSSGAKLRFRLKAGGTTNTLIATTGTLSNSTWYHVAATYDGTTMRVYLDGVEVGSTSKTGAISTNSSVAMWIGGNPPSSTVRPWDGKIDDVRLYDAALSASAISDLATIPPTDVTPPVRSNQGPSALPAGDTQATLFLDTDEPATCRYSTTAGTAYASMTNTFSTTGDTVHASLVTGLVPYQSYPYYVRCQDTATPPNANTDDVLIYFIPTPAPPLVLTESYVYDADGQRAMKTAGDGTVTHYVSGQYQVDKPASGPGTSTTTYFHGSQVVATSTVEALEFPVSQDETVTLASPAGALAGDDVGRHVDSTSGRFIVGAPFDDHALNDQGSAYIYEWDGTTWAEIQTLTPAGAVAQDERFGVHVRLDGTRALVGADKMDGKGAVYVYDWNGSSYGTETKIPAPVDVNAGDLFGSRFAVDGDTLVVSSFLSDDTVTDSGSVYVFEWNGSAWVQSQKLNAWDVGSEAGDGPRFGTAIAIDGDTLMIGAYKADGLNTDSGAVYVYTWDGNDWVQDAKLTADDGEDGDAFGHDVALHDSVLAIGAFGDADSGVNTGAVYTFEQVEGEWTQQTKITLSDGATGDHFGHGLSLESGFLGVGAFGRQVGAVGGAGSVFVYKRLSPTSWTLESVVTRDVPAANESFGLALSLKNGFLLTGAPAHAAGKGAFAWWQTTDIIGSEYAAPAFIATSQSTLGDGFYENIAIDGDHVFVSAGYDDDDASNAGAVYVFSESGGTWTETGKLKSATPEAGGLFGGEIQKIAADNGYLAVGAHLEDVGAYVDQGKVHLFKWDGTNWVDDPNNGPIVSTSTGGGHQFGRSLDLKGDVLAVSAINEAITPPNYGEGAVHVYEKDENGVWQHVARLHASDHKTGLLFGTGVAVDGDVIAVSAPTWDAQFTNNNQGAVYIFERNADGTWPTTETQRIHASDSDTDDNFGHDISVSGNYVVVSTPFNDDFGDASGAAYVFKKTNSGWVEQKKILAADGHEGAWFGRTADVEGDLLIVGAQNHSGAVGSATGQVYVYRLQGEGWTEVSRIRKQDAAALDSLGTAVAIQDRRVAATAGGHHSGGVKVGGFVVVDLPEAEWDVQYLHADHLGSPVAATDQFGNLVGTQSFFPFGETRPGSTGIFDTERGFTGQIFDAGTGLGFYNARYYDTALGRFVSPDSIVPNASSPVDWNRYSYVRNNPTLYIDETGNWPKIADFVDDVKALFQTTKQFNPEDPPTIEKPQIHLIPSGPVVLIEGTFALEAGVFVSISAGVAYDEHGNVGFTITPAVGGSTNIGLSADLRPVVFDADSIYDLQGWFALVEGNVGPHGCSLYVGEATTGVGCSPEAGLALLPAGINGGASYTWLIPISGPGQPDSDEDDGQLANTVPSEPVPTRDEFWESAS